MTLAELRAMAGERCHVAILTEPYLSRLLTGQKTVESRWMTHRIAPYGKVDKGELVYVKKSGGPVLGSFRVGWHLESLIPNMLPLVRKHQASIGVDDAFVTRMAETRQWVILLEVTQLQTFASFELVKPGMAGWVVLP